MLRDVVAGKVKINEYYYENSEGQNFTDYDLWSQTVKTKYPTSKIIKEWDTDVAIDNDEQVAFWDELIKHGVVYDLNLVKKENKIIESSAFNLEGFKENMNPYVKDIEKYIEFQEDQQVYKVNIPFSALNTRLSFAFTPPETDVKDVANKILKIAQLYPRCISHKIEQQEIKLVFTNS